MDIMWLGAKVEEDGWKLDKTWCYPWKKVNCKEYKDSVKIIKTRRKQGMKK